MPCEDHGRGSIELDFHSEAIKRVQKRATKLTQMLCATCKLADAVKIKLPPSVEKWWKKHKRQDRKARKRLTNQTKA